MHAGNLKLYIVTSYKVQTLSCMAIASILKVKNAAAAFSMHLRQLIYKIKPTIKYFLCSQ